MPQHGRETKIGKQKIRLSPFERFVRKEAGSSARHGSIVKLVLMAKHRGIVASADDVWSLGARHGRYHPDVWPKMISDFVASYSAERDPTSVLDPQVGLGTPILTFAEQAKSARSIALCGLQEVFQAARTLDSHGRVDWLLGELNDHERVLTEEFDLVVCFPPLAMGSVVQRLEGSKRPLRDSPGHLFIPRLGRVLTPDGVGVFVVSPKFLRDRHKDCVRNRLTDFGLSLTAYVSAPHVPGIYGGLGLAFIRKGASGSVFAGILSENRDRNLVLLRNLVSRTDGGSITAGRLVTSDEFVNPETISAEERISRIADKRGMAPQRLGAIARNIAPLRLNGVSGTQEPTDALYLPSYPLGPAVTAIEQLTSRTRNCIQVILDDEVADARYVAGFFNSPNGRTMREAVCSAHGVSRVLTQRAAQELVVLLPDKKTQLRVIETDSKAASLISEVRELREELWQRPLAESKVRHGLDAVNRDDSFPNWLEALPFPLASILWLYHTAKGDDLKQYQHLDHFFEALSQFLATLALSAFRTNTALFDEEWPSIRDTLDGQSLSIRRATIGTWLVIAERISKRARQMLTGDESGVCLRAFCTSDRSVLDALLNKRLISAMRSANSVRNDWRGHGGIIGTKDAYNLRVKLDGLLKDVRECFGTVWNRYQLVRAGQIRMLGEGEYSIRLETVMGRTYPFVARESVLEQTLLDGQLYFLGEEEPRALPLVPFVTLHPSPEDEKNACYFFSRANENDIKLVSYHFETASQLKREFVKTREILDELSAT